MRITILFIVTLFSTAFLKANAQQQAYKALLNTLKQHAETDFKDIIGEQSDSSAFSTSKIIPDVGNIKIGKFVNVVTLNWTMPLAQSSKIQIAASDFMKVTYADNKLYKIVSDGTEDEGYITTNVYALGTAKPLLIFQTVYYKNSHDSEKSQFMIVIYGK